MHQPPALRAPMNTLRVPKEQLRHLLETMDARQPSGAAPTTPNLKYRYWKDGVVVELDQPGIGPAVPYAVHTHRLGADGVSFLHGTFIHRGTRCRVQLITVQGNWETVEGRVTECQHVAGRIHEVVVRFDHDISPERYSPEASHARVLVVEDDAVMTHLVTHHLKQLNAAVQHADNGEAAVELALSSVFDLILMDLTLPGMDGFEATAILRSKGYAGMIAAFTSDSAPDHWKRCLQAGFDQCLSKPYGADELARLLGSLQEEPLYSRFHTDPEMAALINEFVGQLPGQIAAIQTATAEGDVHTLRDALRAIKEQGTSFGFDPLSETAAGVLALLDEGVALDRIAGEVPNLLKQCRLARGKQ